MKKLLIVGLIVLFLSMVGSGPVLAQSKPEPGPTAGKALEEAKPEPMQGEYKPMEKGEAPKPVPVTRLGGEVVTVDAAAGRLTIDQETVHKHGKMELTASKEAAKTLPDLRAGDLVNVWVRGKVATEIVKVN